MGFAEHAARPELPLEHVEQAIRAVGSEVIAADHLRSMLHQFRGREALVVIEDMARDAAALPRHFVPVDLIDTGEAEGRMGGPPHPPDGPVHIDGMRDGFEPVPVIRPQAHPVEPGFIPMPVRLDEKPLALALIRRQAVKALAQCRFAEFEVEKGKKVYPAHTLALVALLPNVVPVATGLAIWSLPAGTYDAEIDVPSGYHLPAGFSNPVRGLELRLGESSWAQFFLVRD